MNFEGWLVIEDVNADLHLARLTWIAGDVACHYAQKHPGEPAPTVIRSWGPGDDPLRICAECAMVARDPLVAWA